MSAIKWLNNFLYMENLLGIYRKYSSQKKSKKCLIILQIFIQTIFHASVLILKTKLLLGGKYSQIKLIYWCFSTSVYINSVSFVMVGINHSHDFMSYYRSISRVSERFTDDKKVIHSLKKTICCGIAFVFIFILITASRSVEGLIELSHSNSFIIIFPIAVSLIFVRVTVVFQYLMFYVLIMLVFKFFKSLTALISVPSERVGICDISSNEHCEITRKQIQEWVELYQDLTNCCEKVTLCFGRQYFFSLTLAVSQYIVLMYEMVYTNFLLYLVKSKEGDELLFGRNTDYNSKISGGMFAFNRPLVLSSYISVMVMPLVAGQLATSQGVKFRRVLVRLYNKMIIIDSSEVELRLVKDFVRLIKKSPIEVKLLTKLPAGTYMFPVILGFVVNYVIVMLQFNHVI